MKSFHLDITLREKKKAERNGQGKMHVKYIKSSSSGEIMN